MGVSEVMGPNKVIKVFLEPVAARLASLLPIEPSLERFIARDAKEKADIKAVRQAGWDAPVGVPAQKKGGAGVGQHDGKSQRSTGRATNTCHVCNSKCWPRVLIGGVSIVSAGPRRGISQHCRPQLGHPPRVAPVIIIIINPVEHESGLLTWRGWWWRWRWLSRMWWRLW